jgi:single-stranded-DNA-specific exonuclease
MIQAVRRAERAVEWSDAGNIPALIRELLIGRGCKDALEAEAFLYPDSGQLHDPLLLSDMPAALARINAARERGERVVIYGDYDVDGVCASAMLLICMRSLGLSAHAYIPSRHDEGYGLNRAAIDRLAQTYTLLVTVDCGITDASLIDISKALGMDVIVTDHHQPGARVPNCPVINPMLNGYPFPSLCGAGVAFKLIQAILGLDAALNYIDLAALATVADVVPLAGENRVLVKLGLEAINSNPRPGVAALISAAGMNGRPVTSTAIAFQIAPRLNAGGRVGDAERGLKLLIGEGNAGALAAELESENEARKQIEQRILSEAEQQLSDFDFHNRYAIVLKGDDWNPGIIGLAASRLAAKYNFPVILLAGQNDAFVGSCRSIPGIDIHEALVSCERCFTRYGGHSQAAGFTLPRENLPEFKMRLEAHLQAAANPFDYVPKQMYDAPIAINKLNIENVKMLDLMQPTGYGNPAPVFLSRLDIASARGVGAGDAHLKLIFEDGGIRMDGIYFGRGELAGGVRGTSRHVAYAPQINRWMDKISVQLDVKSILPEPSARAFERYLSNHEALARSYLTELVYNNDLPDIETAPSGLIKLKEWLANDPRGTLIISVTEQGAGALNDWLLNEELHERVDAHAGRWPEDRRAFNAACMCPTGPAAVKYQRIILWDMPASALIAVPPGADVYTLADAPAARSWLNDMPGVDQLRALYRSLREAPPIVARSWDQLLNVAAGIGSCGALCAIAGLRVLERLELVKINKESPAIMLLEVKKRDPEADALFRRIQEIRVYGR